MPRRAISSRLASSCRESIHTSFQQVRRRGPAATTNRVHGTGSGPKCENSSINRRTAPRVLSIGFGSSFCPQPAVARPTGGPSWSRSVEIWRLTARDFVSVV
jgi:hypothetical protein